MRDRVSLSVEEHLGFVHLCGRSGVELERLGDMCLSTCEVVRDCLLSHAVWPSTLLSSVEYEVGVDELMKGVKLWKHGIHLS